MKTINRSKQLAQWTGQFGDEYTKRNLMSPDESDNMHRKQMGISLIELHTQLLSGLLINRILEVGCNIGNQIALISRVSDFVMFGLEPQYDAVNLAHARVAEARLVRATGFEIPFKDGAFDLVVTCGVLIHIAPANLPIVMREIYRCSARYIMGNEYWAETLQELTYRAHDQLLWKMDYESEYQRLFPNLSKIRSVTLEYNPEVYGVSGLFNKGFVLEKTE